MLGERPLRQTLDALIGSRLEAEEAFARAPGDLVRHWHEELLRRKQRTMAGMLAGPEIVAAAEVLRRHVADDPGDRIETQRRRVLGAMDRAIANLNDTEESSSDTMAATVAPPLEENVAEAYSALSSIPLRVAAPGVGQAAPMT